MALSFDHVLEDVVRICEARPDFASVEAATIVRDVRGRVRLALRVGSGLQLDASALEADLKAALGGWFEGPLLGEDLNPDLKRIRSLVFEQDVPWTDASDVDPAAGSRINTPPGRWHLLERRLSKLEWLAADKAKLPWELAAGMPAVVTFYSFKGGVGRTTLVASTALLLALDGKRVVVVDLDVEAPGAATLLGATTERGVVDYLVEHAALGRGSLDGLVGPAQALGDQASLVQVVGAGTLGPSYFEKLARLDFVGAQLGGDEPSPVTQGLRSLLRDLARQTPRPDYILLDSRAGLHDVAGLSLHDLAHVDVLVGRDSDQGYLGLELTVMALGKRRSVDELLCLVVQTMAPNDPGSEEYARITEAYRRRSYDAFQEHVYAQSAESDPDLDDDEAAHYPAVVGFEQRLLHFTKLDVVRAQLTGPELVAVKDRITALCTPAQPTETDS